jgi:hypothetical protein
MTDTAPGVKPQDRAHDTLAIALAYLRAGLSIIPIARDGTKQPDGWLLPRELDEDTGKFKATWNPFKDHAKNGKRVPGRLPTEQEVREWFGRPNPPGIAVIGGAVSGGLECLDFDTRAEDIFPAWGELVEAEAPGLLARVSVARTPKPGYHVRYRCLGVPIPGNAKLAEDPTLPPRERTLIETRGEGGYALAPGCPAECHETGRLYAQHSGPPLSQVRTISAAERTLLIRCASAFDRKAVDEPEVKGYSTFRATSGASPGDDFNRRGPDWPEILTDWTLAGTSGKERRWRRPDKEKGWSATTGVCFSKANNWELLKVFSSNAAPFEPDGTYSKFAAYALLHHRGDFTAAARALAAKGYGTPQHQGNGKAQPGGAAGPTVTSPPEPWAPPVPLSAMPEAEPFPLWVLPKPLQRFVAEAADALNCPPDFVAVPLLALAGGAVGNARRLAIRASHTQGACLFAICVGWPSSGKSPALDLLVGPFEAAERRYRELWAPRMEEWKKQKEKDPDDKPVLRRVLLDDTTTEAMAQVLGENPRGLVMVRDEAAAIVTGLNQYKQGKGHDRQVYLKLWAQATIRVDRKMNPDGAPVVVHRPFVAITGGIQPSVVERLRRGEGAAGGALDDGFLDRFLFAYPKDLKAVGERWLDLSEEAAGAWAHAADRLLSLGMVGAAENAPSAAGAPTVFAGAAESERERPFLLRLSPAGKDAWKRFTDRHAAEVNSPDFLPHLRGPWGKLYGYCGRLALILHYLRWAFTAVEPVYAVDPVDGESMEAAARLVAYFKSHARKVYAALDADPRVADAKRVLGCLADNPELDHFTRRDLYQHLRRYFKKPEALDPPLRLLVECGYLRPTTPERGGRPGPNPERYQVNPRWGRGRTHNPQDPQDRPPGGEPGDPGDCVYGAEGGRGDACEE